MSNSNARLVAPAILRKYDPRLPGLEESLLELEGVSLPRFQVGFPPQRLTMTLLGDFWAGREEAFPSAALVRLLGAFDIKEQAARVALGRLVARGALIPERRGRTTWYRQSPYLLAILPQGRAITARFGEPRLGWDGTWSLVTWSVEGGSPSRAQRIRLSLRELGFAPLGPGIWVSPDPSGDELATVLGADDVTFTVLNARDAEIAGSVSPRSAWDLDDMRPEYAGFLDRFRPALADSGELSPSDALVMRTRAVYRWFVIATLDPDLPAALLPPDWPRVEASRLFVDLVDRLTPPADRYVRSVLAACAPELEQLVTMPAVYGPQPYAAQ